jgi:hypothetical protein
MSLVPDPTPAPTPAPAPTPDPAPAPPEPTPTPAPEPTPGKTFTQAELDRVIADRLARQKAQFADYDELKAKADKLKEIEDANKTELERAQQRAQELETQATEAAERAKRTAMRAAIVAEASKQGAVDPEDVFALLDKTKVTIGDDDQVTGAAEAVKDLLESKKHLVGPRSPGPGDGGPRTPAPAEGDLATTTDPNQVRELAKKHRR